MQTLTSMADTFAEAGESDSSPGWLCTRLTCSKWRVRTRSWPRSAGPLRGELLHAGWKIDSSGTPLVGTELRRSFDQFCCSLADVDRRPDIRENRCPVVPRWSRGPSLDSGGPTRYSDACDLLDSIVTRDRATRPDIRIDMSDQIGATWATSPFLDALPRRADLQGCFRPVRGVHPCRSFRVRRSSIRYGQRVTGIRRADRKRNAWYGDVSVRPLWSNRC